MVEKVSRPEAHTRSPTQTLVTLLPIPEMHLRLEECVSEPRIDYAFRCGGHLHLDADAGFGYMQEDQVRNCAREEFMRT